MRRKKGDLISRSALLEELKEQHDYIMQDPEVGKTMKWCEAVCFHRTVKTVESAPAVDAETVFETVGLVKEAFEMAKADLVAVCRCKDCEAWQTKTAMSFLRDGVHARCCSCGVYGRLMYDDDFCSKGKRRTDDADSV